MMSIINFLLLTALFVLLVVVSYGDIYRRTISNRLVSAVGFLTVLFALLQYGEIFWSAAAITLAAGFLLFSFNLIGAGDVKLLTVLMLTVPPNQVMGFLFFTAFCGLLLIIVGWLFWRNNIRQHGLPYGVAISAGFLLNFWLFYL